MAGLLTHLVICFIGFVIIYLIFRNWKFGAAFVLGHLMPDLIDFGITGIKKGSVDPGVIMTNPWFHPLAVFSHNPFTWIIIATVVWVIALLFYSFKKISKEKFADVILIIMLFLIGLTIHLIVDKLIIEANYWI